MVSARLARDKLKLNVDAAIHLQGTNFGVGIVCRDHDGGGNCCSLQENILVCHSIYYRKCGH